MMTGLHYSHLENSCLCFKTQVEVIYATTILPTLHQNHDLLCVSGVTVLSLLTVPKAPSRTDRNGSPVKDTATFHCSRLPLGSPALWIAWAPASQTPPFPAVSGAPLHAHSSCQVSQLWNSSRGTLITTTHRGDSCPCHTGL